MRLSEDQIEDAARDFAIDRHGSQLYGNAPYWIHLRDVADRCSGPYEKAVAWLHDVIEDTALTEEEECHLLGELRERFGATVARAVSLLSDENGADRSERKSRTYRKVKSERLSLDHPEHTDPRSNYLWYGCTVKVADRIANMTASVYAWDRRRLILYLSEFSEFSNVYFPNAREHVASELTRLVKSLWPQCVECRRRCPTQLVDYTQKGVHDLVWSYCRPCDPDTWK